MKETVVGVNQKSNLEASRTIDAWTGLLAVAWVLVFAAVPMMRFIAANYGSALRLGVLALVLLCLLGGKVRRPFAAQTWLICGILIVISGAISGTESDITDSLSAAVQWALLIGLSPFILRYFILEFPKFKAWSVQAFLVVQTLSAAVGLIQVVGGISPFGIEARGGRANGLADHPNVLGLMAILAILISVAILLRSGVGSWKRFSLFVVLVMNLAALIASGSLSNMLALAIGLVVLLAASRATLRFVTAVFALTALSWVLAQLTGFGAAQIASGIQLRVSDVTGELDGEGSLGVRQQTWSAAWELIASDPVIGVGLDPANSAVVGTTVVHNYILQFWHRGGATLLVVALLLTLVMLRVVVNALRRNKDVLPAAVMAAILAFALTSAFFNQQEYWLPLMLATAASTPAPNREHKRKIVPESKLVAPLQK